MLQRARTQTSALVTQRRATRFLPDLAVLMSPSGTKIQLSPSPHSFVTLAWILPAAHDAARTPMVGLMLGYVIRAGKEFHQHKPSYEAADVSPESDAAAL